MKLKNEVVDINDYSLEAQQFAAYPEAGTGSLHEGMYLALGLVGEAGECSEKIKKLYRDGRFVHEDFVKELGDVFWYLTQLCAWAETTPSQVLTLNLNKLKDRKERNKIKGEGDNR